MILGAMREVCDRWERKKEIRYPGNFVVTKILIQSQFLKYEFSGRYLPRAEHAPGYYISFSAIVCSVGCWITGNGYFIRLIGF
jgi:hypothetical protein